jgi:hypothetical protein
MWIKISKIIIWSFIFALLFFTITKISKKETIIEKAQIISEKRITNIKLAFVGDIMLDRGVKYSVNKNFGGDYGELFTKVKTELQGYDLLFGNLEGPVSDKGVDGGSIYSFRMEPVVLPALKEAGFDGFSLDNNHILNYGVEAMEDTKIRLSKENFTISGESINLGSVKIIILTFDQFAGIDLEVMKEKILTAKLNNDLVITYFHFGDEYIQEPNEYQKTTAKLAIDAGADLVLGAHPHVIQTLEQYKNKYIMYSLGNFIFDQNFSVETMQGGLLEIEVNPNNKQIEKVTLKKVILNSKFQIESII